MPSTSSLDAAAIAMRVEQLRNLARTELAPLTVDAPQRRVNRRLVRALGETGLLGRLFPARFGGSAEGPMSVTELCALREGLAQESTVASAALALQAGGSYLFIQQARPEVAAKWVPPVVAGTAVAAVALTEPDAGSDMAAMAMRAEADGEGWALTGEKAWIMNAPDADVYTIFAKTKPEAGRGGISAFLVPGDSAGLSGTPIDSLWPGAVGRLMLDGVRVPREHLLGELDDGFRGGLEIFNRFRPAVAAHAVGVAARALQEALSYAATRNAFGQPIAGFQAVSHKLADMATQLQAARLLVYYSAQACDSQADRLGHLSAMGKLLATETAQSVVDQALQIHGASGLEHGHVLAHLYNEIRAARIYEGTSEIQRDIIAHAILNAD